MTISLYEIIKKTSQEKGKKVKVVSDYDDVIQAHKSFALYYITNPKIPFKDYFKSFWDKVEFTWIHGGSKRKIDCFSYIFDELENEDYKRLGIEKEKFEKIRKERDVFALLKTFKKTNATFYNKTPFLSIADELLQALKEDLISELVIVSSFRKGRYPKGGDPRKLERFKQTFGHFSNVQLVLIELMGDEQGEPKPYRWDWAKKEQPDLDIFIDDSQNAILETRKLFSSDVKFIMPDYKTNEKAKGDNIYQVRTTISSLKNEEFQKAVWEYKVKKNQEQEEDWINIHPDFTEELIQMWTSIGFTYYRIKEWFNTFGSQFSSHDYELINWLANTKGYTTEQFLNQNNLEELKQEFVRCQQNQEQTIQLQQQ